MIDDSGRAYVFGDGSKGQLGLNSLKSLSVPALVNKRKPKTQELSIIDVASGEDHNLALDSNRHVLSWGNGQNGKLGHCTSRNCLSPIYVSVKNHFQSEDFLILVSRLDICMEKELDK